MSFSEAPALTTRSRLRSSSTKAHLHNHPDEELAKHDSRSLKSSLRIPSSSTDIPTINTRSHDHHHPHQDLSRDVHAQDVAVATRSKSKFSRQLPDSSTRDPNLSLSTHRIVSYGPSSDSIHSHDDTQSSETQSSSKNLPHDADSDTDPTKLSPNFPAANASQHSVSEFFTKDVLLHIICSLLVLGLVVVAVTHAGMPVADKFMRTFKGLNIFSSQRPSIATSQQVQDLKEHLMLTLQVSTERLEKRVEGLKAEMKEEMKRRTEEAEKMREELIQEVNKKASEVMKDEKPLNDIHLHGGEDEYGGVQAIASYVGERPDYALASGGGRVVGHSVAYKPASSASWIESLPNPFIRSSHIHPIAPIILQPSFNQPGQCLPLASSNVHVEVALRTPIFPDQVTLSHVSKNIAYDISSAPKEFQIYGLAPPLSTGKPASWVLMGEFTYDIHKPAAAQAFPLWETAKKTLTSSIKLHVLSNYGSPSHTCIYRIQVHGTEPTGS